MLLLIAPAIMVSAPLDWEIVGRYEIGPHVVCVSIWKPLDDPIWKPLDDPIWKPLDGPIWKPLDGPIWKPQS